MMLSKQEIESRLLQFLSARPEIDFSYIFGSFVRGEKYEDIDVAVYLRDTSVLADRALHPYGYESSMIGELSSLLHTDKIDFVVLNKAGLTLFTRVINRGKRLFDRDKLQRVHIENTVRKEFIDAKPLRDIQDYYLAKKLNGRNAGF